MNLLAAAWDFLWTPTATWIGRGCLAAFVLLAAWCWREARRPDDTPAEPAAAPVDASCDCISHRASAARYATDAAVTRTRHQLADRARITADWDGWAAYLAGEDTET